MSARKPLTPEEQALAARLARTGPHGEPSPALDARILAAARAATDSPAGPAMGAPERRPARWPWAFGIAASVALAVGIAWQLRPLPEPVVYDEAANARAVAAPESMARATDDAVLRAEGAQAGDAATAVTEPVAPPAMDAAAAARETAEPRPQVEPVPRAAFARRPAVPENAPETAPEPAPPAAPAEAAASAAADMALPPPPPAAPAPPSATSPATAARTKATAPMAFPQAPARDAAARRNAAAGTAAETQAAPVVMDEPEGEDVPPATADSPVVREAWLYRIRELRDAGRVEEARESLMEYVARYPRHAIPDDLEPLLDE